MVSRIAAFLALAAAASGLPAQPPAKERWSHLSAGRFELYTAAPVRKGQEILEGLHRLEGVLDRLGGGEGADRGERVTLFAFDGAGDLEPYLREPPGGDVRASFESYSRSGRVRVVLDATARPTEVLPQVHRTYLLLRLQRLHPDLPFWAQRGLAHFYSTFEVERNGDIRIGLPDRDLVGRLRTRSWIPFHQLFQIDGGSPALDSGETLGQFQAESWVIAHYAVTGGEGGESRASALYGGLESGLPPEEAIRRAYGVDVETFERTLTAYARSGTMPYLTVEGRTLEIPEPAVREVERDELLLRLGRYLLETHDPVPETLVEAHLEPVIEGGSEHRADALAALARLRHLAERSAEAGALYEEAAAAGPKEATSHWFHALYLADAGADLAERRAALHRALELDPTLAEAWVELAESYGATTAAPEAAEAYRRALELLPDEKTLAFNLALVHLRSDDPETARRVAEEHLTSRPDLHERAMREIDRLETLARHNARVARYNEAVRAANAGDVETARALLEELLAEDGTDDLAERARDVLERWE